MFRSLDVVAVTNTVSVTNTVWATSAQHRIGVAHVQTRMAAKWLSCRGVTRLRCAVRVGAVLVGLAVIMVAVGAVTAAPADRIAQPSADEPLVVVDNFLAARNAGDYWGAAGECAALLELQDVDGSWFVDTATTSDWFRQLTDKYLLWIRWSGQWPKVTPLRGQSGSHRAACSSRKHWARVCVSRLTR